MVRIFCFGILMWFCACNSPMPVTANPDDHTTTTGTVGSAQMTNKLPEKAGRDIPVSDTLRSGKDSLP